MKAFVTGATGFVGSAVVRSLLRRGIEVKALVRRSSDMRNIAGLDLEISYGDLLNEGDLTRALRGCDVVYHVAAYYSTDEGASQVMYEVNVRGTKAVMRAALRVGVQRVIHTSTIGTIGQPEDGTLATEETPFNLWDTASHYVKSKYLAEAAALGMCEQGLPVVVVNPCAPVGPRDIKPSSTGQRILDYLNGKLPSFVAGGINFISVHDVAEGEVLAAEKGRVGERYILGHKEGNLHLSDFLALMEQVSGIKPPRIGKRWLSIWPAMRGKLSDNVLNFKPKALTCDPTKAIRELGLPQTPLPEAFTEAVAWFRDNGYIRR
ncbi:MAG: SDR family oxidoreductase [Anaerolineae bacterium]